MDANNELESLRNEVSELRAQIHHDNETRQQLVSAADALLPALAKQQQQWEAQHLRRLEALRRAPELERLREEGLLPKFAVLATRQRAVEEWLVEQSRIIAADHDAILAILELLKRNDTA
jgi:hypothetical protein